MVVHKPSCLQWQGFLDYGGTVRVSLLITHFLHTSLPGTSGHFFFFFYKDSKLLNEHFCWTQSHFASRAVDVLSDVCGVFALPLSAGSRECSLWGKATISVKKSYSQLKGLKFWHYFLKSEESRCLENVRVGMLWNRVWLANRERLRFSLALSTSSLQAQLCQFLSNRPFFVSFIYSSSYQMQQHPLCRCQVLRVLARSKPMQTLLYRSLPPYGGRFGKFRGSSKGPKRLVEDVAVWGGAPRIREEWETVACQG